MAENKIIEAIPYVSKEVEVRSLVNDMGDQTITVGEKASNLIAQKAAEQGKELTRKDFMEAQRGYSWEIWRASNFVISVMMGKYIPPVILYAKNDNDTKKTEDGQQRLTTLWMFVNDTFRLDMSHSKYNKLKIQNKIYPIEEVNGKLFSELPKNWQDSILKHSLTVVVQKCSDEEAENQYIEMADGTKPLKAIEIRKAAMGSDVRNFIYQIIDYSWSYHLMTPASATGNMGIDVVSQFLALLYNKAPLELNQDKIDRIIYEFRDFGISDELKDSALKTAEYISKVTDSMIVDKKTENDAPKKKGKRIKNYNKYRFQLFKNKTYVSAFIYAGYKAYENNIDVDVFKNWTQTFFENPSKLFKSGMATGRNKSNTLDNVTRRLQALDQEIDRLAGKESITTSNVEEPKQEELDNKIENQEEKQE